LLEDSSRTFSPKKRAKNLVYYDSREEELRLRPGLVHISSPSTASKSLCTVPGGDGCEIESVSLQKDVAAEICKPESATGTVTVASIGRKRRRKLEN